MTRDPVPALPSTTRLNVRLRNLAARNYGLRTTFRWQTVWVYLQSLGRYSFYNVEIVEKSEGAKKGRLFLRVRETELFQIWARHSPIIDSKQVCFRFPISWSNFAHERFKETWCRKKCQILLLFDPV